MTAGQVPINAGKYSLSRLRQRAHVRVPIFGVAIAAVLTAFAVPTTLLASIDTATDDDPVRPAVYEVLAQTDAPGRDAVVPPVKRERPSDPPASAAPDTNASPPAAAPTTAQSPSAPRDAADVPEDEAVPGGGLFGTVQDWLARANRDYQGIVVKELSMPPPGTPPLQPTERDDPIAKKLAAQQAEDARRAAEAKAAEDAARKSAEAKAAADAKAAEAKRLEEDRRRAEETKRLADETKRKADELLKDAATPAAPPPATETSDQQRREAQKLADENKRQEQLRQSDAERRADAERKRLEAVRVENEKRQASDAAAASQMHRRRTFVLTAEPISQPENRGAVYRPVLASSRSLEVPDEAPARQAAMDRAYSGANASYPGTAVKRWVRRVSAGHCPAAGRRITPPGRYTVKRGDSLWLISKRHYRKGKLYGRIYSANRSRIRSANLIYPCQRVLVPKKKRR